MIQLKQIKRKRLVLVVEDQEINRDVLGAILEDEYDVIYAENGAEALEQIQAHVDDLSIVLLDLMMPVLDGFEVMRRVRADARMARIPIIILTSEKSAELKALQLGAADFITKPFDMHEVVLARVERIIELCEGRLLITAAERDRLTGLYTRSFFFQYVDQIFRYHPDWRMDAIVLNIERFHSVNDLNGREFGDRLLSELGAEIQSFLRETKGIASRVEADRFELFCVCNADYEDLLQRLQRRINEMSNRASIRLRMGVQPWKEGLSPTLMFDRARTACNMVRGSYKSHLMIYDEDMHNQELFNQRLLNDLQRAVAEKQFLVWYQPKYDIQCDPPRLVSAEALIRWKHAELGMLPPFKFIPLFESNGLIQVCDNYVWREAARQVAEWKGKYGVTVPVSVNLSRNEIFDPGLEENLLRLIRENGLSTGELKLEVTESAYTDNPEQLISVINRLREKGFQIEMDDFGSGYSSLNMLSSLPIDVLKMDMQFVRNIETNDRDFRLIELILDIARYLNVPVVAEGVETRRQLELLRKARCDIVQGYYFSKPGPPDEFEKLIKKERGL